MAKKTLSGIRAIIRQKLRDEISVGPEQEWEDDELNVLINDCLTEISESSPYEVRESLKTTAGSKELDISSIEDLMRDIEEVYFQGSKRNCTVFGNTLTIDTNLTPAADETVYLYCEKLHKLTASSSTLKPKLERLLILGVVGQAAINRARILIGKVNVGGPKTPAEMEAWGIRQWTLYKGGLNEIAKPRLWVDHPKN